MGMHRGIETPCLHRQIGAASVSRLTAKILSPDNTRGSSAVIGARRVNSPLLLAPLAASRAESSADRLGEFRPNPVQRENDLVPILFARRSAK